METIETLVDVYAKHARAHGAATENGDHRGANDAYDKIIECVRALRSHGNDARESLASLMEHEDASVRCWAAGHSLDYRPKESERVLQEVAAGAGLVAFTAETILSEWKKGTLRIPG